MGVKTSYKQSEGGVLPEDWESTTARDIASPVRNAIVGGPFGSDLVSSDYVEDGVPVLRGQNMGARFVSGSFVFVSRVKASSLEANLARPGDLVFTQRGTLGQVSLVPDQPYDRYLVSQSQMKLTVNQKAADPLFFYYVFSSAEQQEFIRQNTIQTGVPHINLSILRAIPVRRPSLAEQETIAGALSDADALIESLEQLLAKKRQLKQGAMQELLTGKKRLPGFEIKPGYKQTEVGVVPLDWEVVRLHRVVGEGPKNGYSGRSRDDARGTPTLSLAATSSGRLILNESTVKRLERPIPAGSSLFLEPFDVLVQRSNTTDLVGTTAVFDGPSGVYVYPDLMMRLRFKTRVTGQWFWRYANSSRGRSYFRSVAAGSTGSMPKISGSRLREMLLPIPPPPEQVAIDVILSDMDAELATLEAKLAKARQLKQGMMQELLTGRIRLV